MSKKNDEDQENGYILWANFVAQWVNRMDTDGYIYNIRIKGTIRKHPDVINRIIKECLKQCCKLEITIVTIP